MKGVPGSHNPSTKGRSTWWDDPPAVQVVQQRSHTEPPGLAPPGLEAPERVVRRVSRQKLQVPSPLKRRSWFWPKRVGGEEDIIISEANRTKRAGDEVYLYLVGGFKDF